ncbi:hypothetical protein Salat_1828200 [Sesamum alatum]|uniref:Uncharacterized protein n=1 Tax=Sesamum alatum TaxID=300844 RepID=A0AAE1Y384_9LAMI|nr:hypothetical protein Salat_1828200 [Sesamum alatum]
MAAQEQEEESHESQEQRLYDDDDEHYGKLLSSYLGLSFTIFLGLLPRNSIPLLTTLQNKNKVLSFKLMQAEEQLKQLHSRRKEDSKANARVVEIFASHRHSWQQEEKRLLQQIDECNEEIAYLKGKVEDFERVEAELKANVEDLKREISERDEMLNFMSRSNCEMEGGGVGECYSDMGLRYGKDGVSEGQDLGVEECFNGGGVDEIGSVYGQSNSGFSSDFLNSATSKFWSENASLWQDMQYDSSLESLYHMKHFVSRRESPWKVDGDSTGISSKLKLLEQELMNLERISKADLSKLPSQLRKQAKRYQTLAGKIDDLCRRMQANDPCEANVSSEFRMQRQTEFLLEAFRLQQRASETNQKLTALQSETGKNYNGDELQGQTAKLATRRSFDSIRNNFKEIQRNLEIWLARIIGDLEGILARDGAYRARDYYVSSSLRAMARGPLPGPVEGPCREIQFHQLIKSVGM